MFVTVNSAEKASTVALDSKIVESIHSAIGALAEADGAHERVQGDILQTLVSIVHDSAIKPSEESWKAHFREPFQLSLESSFPADSQKGYRITRLKEFKRILLWIAAGKALPGHTRSIVGVWRWIGEQDRPAGRAPGGSVASGNAVPATSAAAGAPVNVNTPFKATDWAYQLKLAGFSTSESETLASMIATRNLEPLRALLAEIAKEESAPIPGPGKVKVKGKGKGNLVA